MTQYYGNQIYWHSFSIKNNGAIILRVKNIDAMFMMIKNVDAVLLMIINIDAIFTMVKTIYSIFTKVKHIDTLFMMIKNIDTVFSTIRNIDTIISMNIDAIFYSSINSSPFCIGVKKKASVCSLDDPISAVLLKFALPFFLSPFICVEKV